MGTILIIEDDVVLRQALQSFFVKKGYTILIAPEGRTGLAVCNKTHIDIVITDIVMPEMEGLEIIITIRKKNPGIKIIAMSGGGQIGPEDYLEMAKKLGADRVLTKPIDFKTIYDTVENLMSNSNSPQG